ncbi:MAG: hypothetical protein J5554_14395, partial [Paludibacteraceae bacterium]|nr:hypothetical protein [Paludibacteraceae bacterium]
VQETYKDGTPTGYYLRGPQDYIQVTPGTMTGKCQYQAWAARDESLLPEPVDNYFYIRDPNWEGPGTAANVVSGICTCFNPLLSLSNDGTILLTGKDMFEHECNTRDKILAGADMFTFGAATKTKLSFEAQCCLKSGDERKTFIELYTKAISVSDEFAQNWPRLSKFVKSATSRVTYQYHNWFNGANTITTSFGSVETMRSCDK